MAKLTNAMRNSLKIKVCAETFKKRKDWLRKHENDLANEIYQYMYGSYIEKMMELPRHAFNWVTYVAPIFHKPGEPAEEQNYVDPIQFGFVLPEDHGNMIHRPKFYSHVEERFIPKDCELYAKWRKYDVERRNLISDNAALLQELDTMLKACTTLNRLREVWPEGKKWIDEIEPPPPVPAIVNVNKLNSIICEEVGSESPCCTKD